MKVRNSILFSFLLFIAFIILFCLHGAGAYQKVNILGCLECHDSSFSKGSIHSIHMNFYCEACHAGEGLDLGIVYAVTCVSCHPSEEPGACPLVFVHESFVSSESDPLGCTDCHLECTGATTSRPSTSITTTAAITTSTTTTVGNYCVVEAIYGESSEITGLFRWVRDTILSKTSEGRKIMEIYYAWSPVVVKMMERDEDLKEKVHQFLDEIVLLNEMAME